MTIARNILNSAGNAAPPLSMAGGGRELDFGDIMRKNHERYQQKWQGPHDQKTDHYHRAQSPSSPRPRSGGEGQGEGANEQEEARNEVQESPRWQRQATQQEQQVADSLAGASRLPPSKPSTAKSQKPLSSNTYHIHQTPDGVLLQRKHVHLSLCMIVRDNESTIGACLESIYPWVDEIVIVDTGSVDRTPEICRQFGARMFEFPWCDDFSAARNESLRHARGEWIFWTDSDDVVPEEQGRALRALACGNHDPRCLGYMMQVQCPSERPGEMTVVDQVKLFRRLPELRFEHRIHEQILPSITRAGGTVTHKEFFVVHTGSVQSPETRKKKLERDFRILQLDLDERPNHPFVLFNLGMTCEYAGMYEEAEAHLRQCLS